MKPFTVLVVDDDAQVRKAMQRLLTDEGYAVCLAATGEGALRLLNTEPIDLVLLDLQLAPGGLDGWDVARRKQQSPHTAKIPFIIISGTDTTDALAKAGKNPLEGALLFIGKPIKFDLLLRAIDTLKGSAPT